MAEYIDKSKAYDYATLYDWLISSVGPEPPVWTDAHIDELMNDFLIFPNDTPAADVVERKEWIFVDERLPECGETVLLYFERNAWDERGDMFRRRDMDMGFQYNGNWHVDGCSGVVGIAWMPRPKPPLMGMEKELNRK